MSKSRQARFSLTEVAQSTGVDGQTVIHFIQHEWIRPVARDEFDEEDIARIHLIEDLRRNFGANDEAIPLILHLMDQLYYIRHRLRAKAGHQEGEKP